MSDVLLYIAIGSGFFFISLQLAPWDCLYFMSSTYQFVSVESERTSAIPCCSSASFTTVASVAMPRHINNNPLLFCLLKTSYWEERERERERCSSSQRAQELRAKKWVGDKAKDNKIIS